jgi:hypothetical protein
MGEGVPRGAKGWIIVGCEIKRFFVFPPRPYGKGGAGGGQDFCKVVDIIKVKGHLTGLLLTPVGSGLRGWIKYVKLNRA